MWNPVHFRVCFTLYFSKEFVYYRNDRIRKYLQGNVSYCIHTFVRQHSVAQDWIFLRYINPFYSIINTFFYKL